MGTWNSDISVFDFEFISYASWGLGSVTTWYSTDYAWDNVFDLVARSLYDCEISSYYDLKDSPDYMNGKTQTSALYQVYPFCHDMGLTIGITDVTFSNDTN